MSHPAEKDRRRFDVALESLSVEQGLVERTLRLVIASWCRLMGWHVRISRAGELPSTGGPPGAGCVVVAAPHRAWVEPFLLLLAWPHGAARLVWLADAATVTRSWWRRLLLPKLGVLPVDGHAGGPRRYAELAAMVLSRGHALAVFPEVGLPSPPDRARRISPGFAYLASRAGAPVVPVVIGGTHRIVRGSSFSVDLLDGLDPGPASDDPFTAAGRLRARELSEAFASAVGELLPSRTAESDERAPQVERWRWLATLFR